jgi:hypothetical protein
VNLVPAIDWKSSPTRWFELPVPADAIVSLPGSAFARVTSSPSVFGPLGCTTRMKGVEATEATGAKSFVGLYGFLGFRLGATLKVLFEPISNV